MRKSYRLAIEAELKAARDIADAAVNDGDRPLTDVERDTIEGHTKKAQELVDASTKEDSLHGQMKGLSDSLGLAPDTDTAAAQPGVPANKSAPDAQRIARKTSIGGEFAKSVQYKDLLKTVPNGAFSEKMRVQSAPMAFGGMKDLFYSGDREASAGFLVQDDRRGLLDPFYERPLSIRALVQGGATNSDTIEYVRMISVTNNAAVVPEATSSAAIDGTTVTDAIGGLKPESTFEFERDSTTVKTIAHWIPITKRALSDAAQIRTMIDSFLRYGLEEALEDELVAGDGTGEHFLGLNSTPGIQTQAAPAGAQTNLDVLRIARRKVQIGGRAQPTAYVLNPLDWESVDLLKDTTNRYIGAGPFAMTTPTLWGLPVVQSEAIAAGTAWCAAWNYAVLYDREQASVQATDSHADFFVRNLVAILAELRAAFAVLRPSAFVKVTLA